jgi:hypothetical protein
VTKCPYDTPQHVYLANESFPKETLDLNIGGKQVAIFSSGCQKLNVAVRHAFDLHKDFKELITLNKSNSKIRSTIKLNEVFKTKKCGLRIENLTRWSSTF